jgi:zinc finger MYND domain-containing protein 10
MEAFVTHDKITPLVADLLTAEVWKKEVLPHIISDVASLSSIKSYLCLYHEASVCNLLEVMLYHRTACEGSEDALVELIDYCYRKFIDLTANGEEYNKRREETPKEKSAKEIIAMTKEDELKKHSKEIEFTCAMTGLSLIRFITDHMQGLSVPVVHQLMENNDLPCVLVPILELKPWLRKNSKGEMEKWED